MPIQDRAGLLYSLNKEIMFCSSC